MGILLERVKSLGYPAYWVHVVGIHFYEASESKVLLSNLSDRT